MKSSKSIHLPAARYRVERPAPMLAEFTIPAKRKVVSNVTRKIVGNIEKAESPLMRLVVKILPIGRGRRGLSASPVVSDGILNALVPRVIALYRKSLIETPLSD